MSVIHVECDRVIAAPAETVYSFLRDYRASRPRILPPESYFDVSVLEGGDGAGTLYAYRFLAGGRERSYRLRVSAPEPGSALVERDELSSLVTTYFVIPETDPTICRVKISSEWQGAGGVEGIMERTFAPAALRSIYEKQLALLEAAVTTR